MSAPKRQHYVPQTYLKNFNGGRNKQPYLYVLSVKDGKIFNTATKNIAVEKDYYTIHKGNDKNQVELYKWEQFYAKYIEPEFGVLLSTMISRCTNALVVQHALVLNKEEKFKLAFHLVFQLLRGPHARAFMKLHYLEYLPLAIEKAIEHFPSYDIEYSEIHKKFETNEDYFKESIMEAILSRVNTNMFMRELAIRSFVFYRASSNAYFITSDNPVVFVDGKTLNSKPFSNGIIYPTTIIMFPISPRLLLCAYHPNFYVGALNIFDCRLIIDGIDQYSQLVNSCNQIQKDQCSEFVYANSREVLVTL